MSSDLPEASPERVERWRNCPVRPVAAPAEAHSLHSYFNVSPECPAGRRVVYFVSSRPDAQVGSLWVQERETGEARVLAEELEVEDAHRQANQQWVAGGDYVVCMDYRGGEWRVLRLDPATLAQTVLCLGRQVFWGAARRDEVPLYGPYWNPGPHRDLELLDVRRGTVRTVLTLDQVLADHGRAGLELFGGERPDSIAFPVVSPDGKRVFFKLSKIRSGVFRSPAGSDREGLFVYELATAKPLGLYRSWGHPAWMPDSRHILRKSRLIDTDTMQTRNLPWYPEAPNSHAAPSPEGTLLAIDIAQEGFSACANHWAIVVGDYQANWRCLHTAPTPRDGTASWRPAHPHPVFSPDGRRIYFNVPQGRWTRLCVAECR